jgi:ABC-type phosphate transport system substrate-binding protein
MLACFVTPQALAIEVITHHQVIDHSLTKSQLRRIYTMRQLRWSDNSVINVFVLPNQHMLHQRFAKERLQIFPYQLNRIWHKLTYSGLGVAPTIVDSEEELIQAVKKTPGSIGYIEGISLKNIQQDQKKAVAEMATSSQKVSVMEKEQEGRSKGVVNVVKIKG